MSDNMQDVPFVVHEAGMARAERVSRRLVIALILTIVLLFASNCVWLYAWMQYDYSGTSTTEDYWQDGNGYNNINTGEQGDVNNGTEISKNDDNENKTTEERAE